MNLKRISCLPFFFLLSTATYGQSDVLTYANNIFSFFSILDSTVEKYFDKESAKQLNRLIGYYETDLEDYLKYRKELLDTLEIKKYKVTDLEWGRERWKKLTSKFKSLTTRLYNIRDLSKRHLMPSTYSTLRRSLKAHESQEGYLSHLDLLLRSKEVDKKLLKEEGEKIYDELRKTLVIAAGLKEAVKKRYNLK